VGGQQKACTGHNGFIRPHSAFGMGVGGGKASTARLTSRQVIRPQPWA
jgi:hypothetical protein